DGDLWQHRAGGYRPRRRVNGLGGPRHDPLHRWGFTLIEERCERESAGREAQGWGCAVIEEGGEAARRHRPDPDPTFRAREDLDVSAVTFDLERLVSGDGVVVGDERSRVLPEDDLTDRVERRERLEEGRVALQPPVTGDGDVGEGGGV